MFVRISKLLIFAALMTLFFFTARAQITRFPLRDFLSFWQASQHITTNPYLNIGMRNPPWALPFVLVLRPFSYTTAFGIWTLITLCSVALSAWIFWYLHTGRNSFWPLLLALSFGPTIDLLFLGQLTALVLTGFALFTLCIYLGRDWLAGFSILGVLVKPHISAILFLIIVIWAIKSRRPKVLYGGAAAVLVFSLVAIGLDYQVFRQYFAYSHDFTRTNNLFPTVGGILIVLSGFRLAGFIPEVLGLVWAIAYFWERQQRWDWKTDGALTLAVSVFACYYAFPYDEVVVIPALIACAICGRKSIFVPGLLVVNLAYYEYMSREQFWRIRSPWWIWLSSTLWLILYVFSNPNLNQRSGAMEVMHES